MCFAHARIVRLGRAEVPEPIVTLSTQVASGALADPSIIANVGDEILGRFTVDFDYARQRLTLSPNGTPLPGSIPDRSGIITLRAEGRALHAALVLTGTAAYAAGLRTGATIVAVDGRLVTSRSQARLRALLRGAVGTRIVLRTGAGRTVVFRLRPYP